VGVCYKHTLPSFLSVGRGHHVIVDVESQLISLTRAWSYNAPDLSSVSPVASLTTGAVSVSLSGSNFGFSGNNYNPSSFIGSTACSTVLHVSGTSVLCKIAPGISENLTSSVSVSEQVGVLSMSFSYLAPDISSVTRSNSGAIPVALLWGKNFGTSGISVGAKIGSTPCNRVAWTSDSSIGCDAVSGYGQGFDVTVIVGNQVRAQAAAFSYSAPELLSVNPIFSSSYQSGSTTISISGSNMGDSFAGVTAKVGHTSCDSVSFINSNTILRCVLNSGTGQGLRIEIDVAGTKGALDSIFSYIPPRLTSFYGGSNSPPAGGFLMTVIGANFGLAEDSPVVVVGSTSAFVTSWQSHTSIVIKPRGGYGISPVLLFNVVNQSSHLSMHFSYDSAQVSSISFASGFLPCTGATVASIFGSNLATLDYSQIVFKTASSASEFTHWSSDTTLIVKVSSGSGCNLIASVTFSQRTGSKTDSISFHKPSIASFTPVSVPTSGFPSLSVSGYGFGQFSASLHVRISSTACNSVMWISDSFILCKVGFGVGKLLSLSVSVSRQVQLLSGLLSFQAPTASSIFPNSVPSSGFTTVTVSGTSVGFAQVSSGLRVTINSTASASTSWLSDTSVKSMIAQVIGPSLSVGFTVASQSCILDNQFSSSAPIISSSAPISHSTVGGSILSLFGKHFGMHPVVSNANLGNTLVIHQYHTSDSCIALEVPAGGGGSVSASLTVSGQSYSFPSSFSYIKPSISSFSPMSSPAVAVGTLTVFGSILARLLIHSKPS